MEANIRITCILFERVRAEGTHPTLADKNAAKKYPNSNSANGWTAQIKIGNKLLGGDGKFYRKPNNNTHIPIKQGYLDYE